MLLDEVLSRVPLILSFPTVLLSSNLIVSTDVERMGEPGAVMELLLRHAIAPLLCASTVAAVGGAFGTIERLDASAALAFVSFSINSLLGHTQTSVLSALLLQILSGCISFSRLYVVFPALSLVLDYLHGESFYETVVSYAVILLTLYCRRRKPLSSGMLFKKQLKPAHFAIFSILVVALMNTILADPIGLFPSIRESGLGLQYSMIFVCLGCLGLLFVSWKEICDEPSTSSALKVLGSEYVPPALGLAAMMLQFLSFDRESKPMIGDAILLVFVLFSWVVSKKTSCHLNEAHEDRHENLHCEEHGQHGHEHQHQHGHEHDHDHSNATIADENSYQKRGLFFQLATNKETRPIFSFLLLNATFMFVQLLYSFRSKSLGLLSDSLHMALDCMSLLLGLIAGLLSKNPPSDTFPFALGYLETLAGFTNGVLLIGIVSGILVEAIDRVMNPTDLLETNELLVVSILGLVVNLIGLFAFDHGGHAHDGGNENMRGIFLHIMADTLGSVGVVISTTLTKLFNLQIFDPIASIFIALLILMSSFPLIKSTTASILLKLNDKQTNNLKNALSQISMTPGITGYTTPRFWPLSSSGGHGGHSHSHGHSHSLPNNEGSCETEKSKDLVGYIHIQYMDGENSTIIKKRVEKILEGVGIKAWIQVEHADSTCWCRSSSLSGVSSASSIQ
ncbi:LANO_0G07624g1_1 [Lachancea nothofagi CBS 11611]|uniref:Zinc transporter n=1 Tax=Lachancea nothofagi CBS 11611 TaxID=1266666 RepID=A0A1G4KHZ3_9SACH|nr:LANO_0G07624g1_1 [Lachancea nothofagi CBS 11611]